MAGSSQRFHGSEESRVPPGKSAGRKPAQIDGKTSTISIANQKLGCDAELGHAHDGAIGVGAPARGSPDAGRKGDQGTQHQRIDRQRQRHPKPVGDHACNGCAIRVGRAEIADQKTTCPGCIAFEDAAAKAQFLTQGGKRVFLGVEAKHVGRWVTRHHFQRQEDYHRRGHEAEPQGQKAFQEILQHERVACLSAVRYRQKERSEGGCPHTGREHPLCGMGQSSQ